MITQAELNKELALHAFSEFAAGNHGVLHDVLAEDFVEHSPGNPSGRDAFIEFITRSPIAKSHLALKRVVAGADHVVMHHRLTREDADIAVVDIWRLEKGRIVEHWDVVQPVPDAAQIPHGML